MQNSKMLLHIRIEATGTPLLILHLAKVCVGTKYPFLSKL
jgi:hypothetical protein